MAGTAITMPTEASAAANGINVASRSTLTPSVVNTFRIAAVTDRLFLHLLTSHKLNTIEFFNLCLSLSRGIDYSVANGEVPGKVQDLPRLVKKICQLNTDSLLQAAIMVLMISVKNACKGGWFSTGDSAELLTLADEMGSNFCTVKDMNTEASNSLEVISTIMERFYPRMKMGQILAFLEVKPGYGTFVIDFHISKNSKPSAEEKIWLFVAQTDNVETSSCIVTPPQVNFLLNGKGVDKRTTVVMETAPQIPTSVTKMLKFGTNLLQAVGQFNGSYIIVVAYMSIISNPDRPTLQDYVQPAVAALDSDTDIMEGPSRITLNCPISFRRMTTPVKGHSCKHLQCFDFDNFVDINSRRPSWRCPHCNQSVSFVDIRVDQNMVKVLKEVGEKVVDVIISADGSWKRVGEANDFTDPTHDKLLDCPQDGPTMQESDIPSDIMDLTMGDDVMDIEFRYETPDRKPNTANLQSQSAIGDSIIPSSANTASDAVPSIDDDFWSGIYLSTYGSGASSAGGISEQVSTANFIPAPVLTDAISSPALNREPETSRDSAFVQNQIPASSHLSLLHSHPWIPPNVGQNHVNRTPVTVQALPSHAQTSLPQQMSVFNSFTAQGPASSSQTPPMPSATIGFNTVSTIERQQQQQQQQQQQHYSRVHLSSFQRPQTTSSSLSMHPAPQNWNRQHPSTYSSQTAQQMGAYRTSSAPPSEHQNFRQQQLSNHRVPPHGMGQSPNLMRTSSNFLRNHISHGSTQSSQRVMGSAQQSGQVTRHPPSVPVAIQTTPSFPLNPNRFSVQVRDKRINPGGTLQSATRTDNLADFPGEQNWRPTARMRGSLSGRAYSDAIGQIIQPTPPVQAAPRPALNTMVPPPGIPAPLHALMTNNWTAALPSQPVNYPPTETASVAGGTECFT